MNNETNLSQNDAMKSNQLSSDQLNLSYFDSKAFNQDQDQSQFDQQIKQSISKTSVDNALLNEMNTIDLSTSS